MAFILRSVGSLLLSLALASAAAAQVNRFNEPKDQRKPEPKQPTPGKAAKDAMWPDTPKKDLHAKTDYRGKKAPAFHVEKWLSDEAKRDDKVVLIDFWATWCGPCRKLIPELKEWQSKFKDDIVVIGVSDEPANEVQNFIRAQQVTYAMAVDTKKTMSKAIGINGIPHVLVISSDGIVRWQGFPGGEDPLTEEKLVQIIQADKAMRAKADEPAEAEKPDTPAQGKKPAANPAEKPATADRPARRSTEYALPDEPVALKAHIASLQARRQVITDATDQLKKSIRELEARSPKDDATKKDLAAAYQSLMDKTTELSKVDGELAAAELKLKAADKRTP